jgi:predicted RNase H-like HicB family nuclease
MTMERTQLTVIIERDPESGWLVGSVTELPGCYSQAITMAEMEVNIREAIDLYLESVGDDGAPYPVFVGLLRIESTHATA